MKFTALIAMAVAGLAETRVPVCVEEHAAIPAPVMMDARGWATLMFRGVGVEIKWTCSTAASPIVVSLLSHAPDGFKPTAMAYALPYEGVHIVVFYDRIEGTGNRHTETLLAYVLVHEITHILQGESRHSETGVMKSRWGANDYARMLSHQLPFAPEDIEKIREKNR